MRKSIRIFYMVSIPAGAETASILREVCCFFWHRFSSPIYVRDARPYLGIFQIALRLFKRRHSLCEARFRNEHLQKENAKFNLGA